MPPVAHTQPAPCQQLGQRCEDLPELLLYHTRHNVMCGVVLPHFGLQPALFSAECSCLLGQALACFLSLGVSQSWIGADIQRRVQDVLRYPCGCSCSGIGGAMVTGCSSSHHDL